MVAFNAHEKQTPTIYERTLSVNVLLDVVLAFSILAVGLIVLQFENSRSYGYGLLGEFGPFFIKRVAEILVSVASGEVFCVSATATAFPPK
jgi:hypothetical protein